MSVKLTDTQLVMLSAAALREDRCLVAPPTLKGGAAQRIANKLISSGLVKEIKSKTDEPVWRRDEGSGVSYALRLTAAGAKAIAANEASEPENANCPDNALENRDQRAPPQRPRLRFLHSKKRGGIFLHALPLHASARSWLGSSNCFSGATARPSTS
jgi:hypothetical protein